MQRKEAIRRLEGYGFSAADAAVLWAHFDDAEQRGKEGHGHARIEWLATQRFDPAAHARLLEERPELHRWSGADALGYLVMSAAVERALAEPPEHVRLVVCEQTFPTGMLGYWARRIAEAGYLAVATATSPLRLGPAGGPKLAGTNPLAIGVPSSDGAPVVTDVSMGAVTWGDVIAGRATEDELVPFGGEQSHKALALAVGLQLLVDSLVSAPGHGAVMLLARPAADPVPRLPEVRLPGR